MYLYILYKKHVKSIYFNLKKYILLKDFSFVESNLIFTKRTIKTLF